MREALLEMLVSPEWVEERKKRWGEQSPIYQSKVLGEFPEIDDYTTGGGRECKGEGDQTRCNSGPELALDGAQPRVACVPEVAAW